MNHFKKYPKTVYTFGDEVSSNLFSDISVYSDMIDQVRNAVGTYQDYYIQSGERPDQVSQKLYDTPEYHWTFMLMNPKLRECGWPLSERELLLQCQRDFPNTTIVTANDLVTDQLTVTGTVRNKILPGVTVTGQSSGVEGIVEHRHLELGQIVVKGTKSFIEGETILLSTDVNVNFVASSVVSEYLSVHHWEDTNGAYVDLIDANGVVDITGGASNTAITQFDRYVRANNSLKEIKVLKREIVGQISDAIKTAIRS